MIYFSVGQLLNFAAIVFTTKNNGAACATIPAITIEVFMIFMVDWLQTDQLLNLAAIVFTTKNNGAACATMPAITIEVFMIFKI